VVSDLLRKRVKSDRPPQLLGSRVTGKVRTGPRGSGSISRACSSGGPNFTAKSFSNSSFDSFSPLRIATRTCSSLLGWKCNPSRAADPLKVLVDEETANLN
jgi:hypothetical protein